LQALVHELSQACGLKIACRRTFQCWRGFISRISAIAPVSLLDATADAPLFDQAVDRRDCVKEPTVIVRLSGISGEGSMAWLTLVERIAAKNSKNFCKDISSQKNIRLFLHFY